MLFRIVLVLMLLPASCFAKDIYYVNIAVNSSATEEDDNYYEDAEIIRNVLTKKSTYKNLIEKQLYKKNATKNNCLNALKSAVNSSKENDLIVIYLGTHGSYDNHYCSSLYGDDCLYATDVKGVLDQSKSTIFLIVDTCHAGGFLLDWKGTPKTFILASCGKEEWAYCGGISDTLAKEIPDLNKDNYIDFSELISHIKTNIRSDQNIITNENYMEVKLIQKENNAEIIILFIVSLNLYRKKL